MQSRQSSPLPPIRAAVFSDLAQALRKVRVSLVPLSDASDGIIQVQIKAIYFLLNNAESEWLVQAVSEGVESVCVSLPVSEARMVGFASPLARMVYLSFLSDTGTTKGCGLMGW